METVVILAKNDIDTASNLRAQVNKINPEILLYINPNGNIFKDNIILLALGGDISGDIANSVCTAVALSEDTDTLSALERLRLPVITCGLSSRDTVSISGTADNSYSISLQRKIRRADGSYVEPCEILIKNTDFSHRTAAVFAAVMLITGSNKSVYDLRTLQLPENMV